MSFNCVGNVDGKVYSLIYTALNFSDPYQLGWYILYSETMNGIK